MFTSTRSPSLPTSLSLQLIYRQLSSLLSVIVSNSSGPIQPATRTRSRRAKMDVDVIDSLGPEFNEIKELVKRVVSIESKVLALHRVLTGLIQKTYPDDAKIWGDLVVCIETFDGGLSRNSSPEALQAWRDIYNALLSKFPLFYGYWSRWATFEFNISGPEAAEYVRQPPRACSPFSR